MEVEKVRINVVSDIDEKIWTSQLPNLENSILQVSFTRIPVPAEIYIVYGVYIEGFFKKIVHYNWNRGRSPILNIPFV